MRNELPLYEGDGHLRPGLSALTEALDAHRETAISEDPLTPRTLARIEREARILRSRVVGELFRRLFAWLSSMPARARERMVERYVSQATDPADLERRLRELERADHRPGLV